MQRLIEKLKAKIITMRQNNIDLSDESLDDLYSVFPFNKFEFIIAHLIATQTLNLAEYLDIRNAYLERNKYLYLFEITASRTFGES